MVFSCILNIFLSLKQLIITFFLFCNISKSKYAETESLLQSCAPTRGVLAVPVADYFFRGRLEQFGGYR